MKGILKPTDEKYLVDEAKGIITYIIKFKPKFYNSNYVSCSPNYALKKLGFKLDWLNVTQVVGIAKCSPEDTFDKKKGIQIARNRAEIKLAQVEQMVIRTLCKEIGHVWDYTSALYNNRSEMIKEKKQFIKNI